MKKILYFLLLLAFNSSFAQVAYYPFNGNANDVSGNNNNPVFNNATLTSDRFGTPNSAYHFNGINTYMRIPNSATLNMGNQLTIAVWVKPTGWYTGKCYNNMMVTKGDGDQLPGTYSSRFSDVYNGCGSTPSTTQERFFDGFANVATLPIVQLNQWYSVVITFDGSTSKLYVNCVLQASSAASRTFTNPYDLYFGHLNSTQFPYWLNGDLDEIKIYNRALTQAEVNTYGGCPNPLPPCLLPNTSTTVQKCLNQDITLNARNGSSYNWTPTTFLSSGTIQSPVCNANTNITYTVRTISVDSSCFNTDTIHVVVNDCGCEDSCSWSRTGNTTVLSQNFIGSKNSADFKIRTNNTQRMVVSAAGNVGINTLTPVKLFEVNGEARISNLPPSVTNDKIVLANTSGDLHSLATTGNKNQYLSGDGSWQNITNGSVDDILARLTKLENEVKEQAKVLKEQLAQMDVILSNTNTIILTQNVPNPFSESTTISYSIPKNFNKAQIIFSTITGEIIKTADIKRAGKGQINVFANDISSGIYTYTLVVDGKQAETKKMIKQ